jgi:peptidoglycan/LPS O-acetylase OafA/YrhL
MIAPLLKRTPSWILCIVVCLSAFWFLTNYTITDRPILGFTWFWLIGFLYRRHRSNKLGYLFLVAPIMLMSRLSPNLYIMAIPVTIVLLVASAITIRSATFKKLMNWAGDLSYPLYLVHVPTIILLSLTGIKATIWYVLASIATAVFALHMVDYPLRARNKLLNERRNLRAVNNTVPDGKVIAGQASV